LQVCYDDPSTSRELNLMTYEYDVVIDGCRPTVDILEERFY